MKGYPNSSGVCLFVFFPNCILRSFGSLHEKIGPGKIAYLKDRFLHLFPAMRSRTGVLGVLSGVLSVHVVQ